MTGSVTPVTAAIARTAPPSVSGDKQVEQQVVVQATGETRPPERPAPAAADVTKAIERLSEFVQSSQRSLRFRVDDFSGRTVITVVNSATDEVIRQIPAEEILALARNLGQGTGAVLDASA